MFHFGFIFVWKQKLDQHFERCSCCSDSCHAVFYKMELEKQKGKLMLPPTDTSVAFKHAKTFRMFIL